MSAVFAKWQKKVPKAKPKPSSDKLLHSFSVRPKPKAKTRATGLHITPSGDFLITDYVERRVRIYSQKGVLRREIGGGGGGGRLKRPWNAIMTPRGDIVISDPGAPDVKLFSPDGRFIRSFNFVTNFQEPYGLGLTNAGEILVADKGANCVYIYNAEGFMLRSCKPLEEDAIIHWPQYVTGDSEGNILLTDYPNHRLYSLTPGGRIRWGGGGAGTEPGEFVCPQGVATDPHGNILVADTANDRVQMLSPSGQWSAVVTRTEDGLEGPEALAIDADGNLVVTEGASGLVKIFRYDPLVDASLS